MKAAIEKVKGNLSTHRMTIRDVVQEVLKKSDPDFGDDEELQSIVSLLKKEPSQRTQLDIDKIRLSFFRFKFFMELEQQMGAEMVQGLYKQLGYELQKKRSTVFNIGDIGKKFYIILKGSTWVLVQKKGLQEGQGPTEEDQKLEEDQRKEKNKELMKKSIPNSQSRKPKKQRTGFVTQVTLDDIFAQMTDQEYLESQFSSLVKVGVISSGESFGEIALTKQVPRTATIIAAEDTHFATVTRDQFNKLLSFYYEAQQKQNVGFLSKVAIFADWNEQMLNQLYYHFKIEEKKLFQIIYKEDEEANTIYLLRQGEVELSRYVDISQQTSTPNLTLQKFFTKNEKKMERVRTSVITAGQIFGHEEVLAGTKREYRAMSISQKVSYFILDKNRFLQYFQKGAALQKLQRFDAKKINQRTQSLDIIKEIKKMPMIIEPRDVPFVESQNHQKQKTSNERVGNPVQHTGYEMLQGHGHINKAHYNFRRNIDVIKQNVKDSEPLSLEKALFHIEASKGTSISIINKVFPAAARPKYCIPDCSISSQTIIKSLKLPKILTEVDSVMLNRSNKEYLSSFKASSIGSIELFESMQTIN